MSEDIRKTGYGEIPISDIIIGERFREDMRDLESLVYSLDTYGQLDPIIVTDAGNGKYKLIAGERRIQAMKRLDKTVILARLFESLDEPTQLAIQLESDVRRANLSWAEKAKGIARLVEIKRQAHIASMPKRFGRQLEQKEIAEQLDMSASALSEELKIAEGLEQHPALEYAAKTRKEALKLARQGRFDVVLDKGLKNKAIDESYLVCSKYDILEQLENTTVDLIILDPDEPSNKLLKQCFLKLKAGGSIIVFTELIHILKWQSFGESLNLFTMQPNIWHIKNEDFYVPFIWFGKNRERPLRLIPSHISCPKSKNVMHQKAKPYKLIYTLIKACTEIGGFVLVPECFDIETLKACLDTERNIRAACPDKILRDQLVLNMTI